MAEGHFEAKLSRKRETAAGIFIELQIQPDDFSQDLAILRVGSRLVLGWAEVVNVEVEPIEVAPVPQAAQAAALPSPKKKWEDLPYSQQAAIRCGEPAFQAFLGVENAEEAAVSVRARCNVNSRSELDKTGAKSEWRELERLYQQHLTDRQYEGVRR